MYYFLKRLLNIVLGLIVLIILTPVILSVYIIPRYMAEGYYIKI